MDRSSIMDNRPKTDRLSIAHLMVVSLTVAIYLAVDRWRGRLHNDLQDILQMNVAVHESTLVNFVLSVGYGVALGLAIVVCVSKGTPLWQHPGKILVLILAAMAALVSLTSLFALLVAKTTASTMVMKFHYLNFSPAIGYLAGILIMLLVLFRNQTHWNWRVAWYALFAFSLGGCGISWLTGFQPLIDSPGVLAGVQRWTWNNFQFHFFAWISIGMAGVAFAFFVDRFRRIPLDWITVGTVSVMSLMWAAVSAPVLLRSMQ